MTASEPGNPLVENDRIAPSRFWTLKHIVTNVIILAFACVAAYLQFYLYPLIMSRPIGSPSGLGFGETNISLHFSVLTYHYVATRCMGSSCTRLVGVADFDFVQALILVLVLVNILHFLGMRKK